MRENGRDVHLKESARFGEGTDIYSYTACFHGLFCIWEVAVKELFSVTPSREAGLSVIFFRKDEQILEFQVEVILKFN